MQKMITKYGLYFDKPKLTAHKLRHTFATNHLAVNNSIPILQKILDHSSPETTMIYSTCLNQNFTKQLIMLIIV